MRDSLEPQEMANKPSIVMADPFAWEPVPSYWTLAKDLVAVYGKALTK